ncbi:glycosyltransferase [Gallibacterium anatis]|uniref:glycosyltransferase n=1 Tax=Gallibacterium anatis TaxID=750 RepID=UPI00068EB9ED|nr:glycosyltransferase [Gallibacterium anatis]MDK9560462.1 glycosyltransferase [Gallibacterium anatis]
MIKEYPKYSVLMTVYKKDKPQDFLLSLESMCRQTISPSEIVIVKDGPIPQSLQDIIDQCKEKYSIIFNEIQLPINKGLGLALNEGIEHCHNELIARMDADDYSMPQRCEKQLEAFMSNQELDIVGCSVSEFIDDINNIVGYRKVPLNNKQIYQFAKKRDPFNHPTVMYRKSLLEKVGKYSDYRKNQDTDLWIRMLQNHAECLNLDGDLFRFRFDEGTYEKRKSWVNTKILIEIRYKAWKSGFNSLGDFFLIACSQTTIYLLPKFIQKILYQYILRR